MHSSMRFSQINSDADFKKIGQFRLDNYSIKKPYMVQQLDKNGLDSFDEKSMVFAAWIGDEIVGSMRLSPYPFETSQLIDSDILQQFLVEDKTHYLELSRLLVSDSLKTPYIVPFSLIQYIFNYVVTTQKYTRYFGYSTPVIRKLFSPFGISNTMLDFTIPNRGKHTYYLLKGNFSDTLQAMKQRGRNVSEGIRNSPNFNGNARV